MHRIVIVGGGAGGLELATKLGNRMGKSGLAQIVLVDANPTHLWKPLLHEVATGAMDSDLDELSYRAHGAAHGYEFHIGRMSSLDSKKRQIVLAPMTDTESGEQVLGERRLSYTTLVLAVGSVTNDFGTKGAAQHCHFLDNRGAAERFHSQLLNAFLRSKDSDQHPRVEVAIIGAGATGVELSAELFNTVDELKTYGMSRTDTHPIRVTLVEAGPRVLPALPERVSESIKQKLLRLGVDVNVGTLVTQITEAGVETKAGRFIPAQLKVWAAGVKAPAFLAELGLKTAPNGALVVTDSLQTSDPDVFALGDCAFLMQESGRPVPPRAQSAHQMADHMVKVLKAHLRGKPLPRYRYNDQGSLISLSRFDAVGALANRVTQKDVVIEGTLAKFMYVSLYRLHQVALHGYWTTLLLALAGKINKKIKPNLKLH